MSIRRLPPAAEPFVIAGILSLLTWVVFTTLAATSDGSFDPLRLQSITDLLGSAYAVLASVVAAMCVLRWRLAADRTALWIGAAVMVLGSKVAFTEIVLPIVHRGSMRSGLAIFVGTIGRVAVIALLTKALFAPDRSSRVRTLLILGSASAIALLLQLVPRLAEIAAAVGNEVPESSSDAVGHLIIGGLWVVVATVFIVVGWRRHEVLYTWFGIMLATLAQFRVAIALAVPDEAMLLLAGQFFRILAMFLALMGCSRELQRAFTSQRARLLESEITIATVAAQRRAERAAMEERAHDIRSALFAVDGAVRTLERHHDALDAESRSSLAHALSSEIARLQNLVVDEPREQTGPFTLAETIKPLVACAASLGQDIACSIPTDLQVLGRPGQTAEVVQNLLDNARRHASGSAVCLRAERDGEWVVLRVEDRGPGVPVHERRAIFERGARGSASGSVEGSGLGLFVAARLIRDQGGELWVDDRPGGGASFGLCLPVYSGVAEDDAHAHPAQRIGHRVDAGEVKVLEAFVGEH